MLSQIIVTMLFCIKITLFKPGKRIHTDIQSSAPPEHSTFY